MKSDLLGGRLGRMTMPENKKVSPIGFLIQFFFGFLFGGVIGFVLWGRSDYALSTSWMPGIVFIGGGALIMGIISGCAGDNFWKSFRDSNWWRLFP